MATSNKTKDQIADLIRKLIDEKVQKYANSDLDEHDLRDIVRQEVNAELKENGLLFNPGTPSPAKSQNGFKQKVGRVLFNTGGKASAPNPGLNEMRQSHPDVQTRSAYNNNNHHNDNDDEQLQLAMALSMADINESEVTERNEQDNLNVAQAISISDTPPAPKARSVYPENVDQPPAKATGPQFDCAICMDKQPLGESVECGCGHLFCTDCMSGYLSNAIREGNVEDIKCPDKDCQTVAQQFLVSYIVSDELYARYEWLLLVAGVKDMPDVYYCPTPGCLSLTVVEIDSATCPKCGLVFCTNCYKPYHDRTDCELTEHEQRNAITSHNDRVIVDRIANEDELNRRAIETIEDENRQWLETIRREQEEIRRAEQLFEEQRRADEERRAEEERRVREQREREERERREQEIAAQQEAERQRLERERAAVRRQQYQQSETTVQNTTKACPGCQSPIERSMGCNRMMCSRCNHEFCYQCMARWPGYHHRCA